MRLYPCQSSSKLQGYSLCPFASYSGAVYKPSPCWVLTTLTAASQPLIQSHVVKRVPQTAPAQYAGEEEDKEKYEEE
jgi:hypothetical protein